MLEGLLSLSWRLHCSPEPDLEPTSKSEGLGGLFRWCHQKEQKEGSKSFTGHLTATSREFSCIYIDYVSKALSGLGCYCFPCTLYLLMYHGFIPVHLLAVLYLSYTVSSS